MAARYALPGKSRFWGSRSVDDPDDFPHVLGGDVGVGEALLGDLFAETSLQRRRELTRLLQVGQQQTGNAPSLLPDLSAPKQ